jgi:hypothetical protein
LADIEEVIRITPQGADGERYRTLQQKLNQESNMNSLKHAFLMRRALDG